MKRNESKNPRKKTFLHIPTFPGGKEAYRNFISQNIVYPEKALADKVEGDVYVSYTVNNIGEVVDVNITRGIGHGCDEEAERVIRLMKYEPARNRGVKMKAEIKTRISFHLPRPDVNSLKSGAQINYTTPSYTNKHNPEPKSRVVYNYSINIEQSGS
jgi:protein TonB